VSQKEELLKGLLDAALVLDDLAAGRVPDRARLLCGALALHTLQSSSIANRDMLDAAAGLRAIVRGGSPYLDETGRALAGALAIAVRGFYASGEWQAWVLGGGMANTEAAIAHLVAAVEMDGTRLAGLSTDERIAVALVLNRVDLLEELTVLEAVERLGAGGLRAALSVQRMR
jgi:hypothetical protein